MGVKGINVFLREKVPEAFTTTELVRFHGHRIAIDGTNWTYSYYGTANREVISKMADPLEEVDRAAVMAIVHDNLLRFLSRLSEYGITPVWCWDGEHHPAKAHTKEERVKRRTQAKEKIAAERAKLEGVHPLLRQNADCQQLKKALQGLNEISKEEMDYLRNLITYLGYPSLQAKSDGEKLCASLAREGLVAGVWSTDTDIYALGAPVLITGFGRFNDQKQPLLEIVLTPLLREGLGLSSDEFVDFCIMCGCDYNTNMPSVGKKRSFDLITKYRSIDAIAHYEPQRPIAILNHQVCRQLFAYEPSGYQHSDPQLNFNAEYFTSHLRLLLEQYQMSHHLDKLTQAVHYLRAVTPQQVVFA